MTSWRAGSAPAPAARIVPFRGEYYSLKADRSHLVRNLIYPVPDPRFPFLGVHLTRGVDGSVHAGPNAVLAFAREGYRWNRVVPRELAGTLGFPGFWRLAAGHYRMGASEVMRSVSRHQFGNSLRRLVPAIRDEDLVPAPAGVRAQALHPTGHWSTTSSSSSRTTSSTSSTPRRPRPPARSRSPATWSP